MGGWFRLWTPARLARRPGVRHRTGPFLQHQSSVAVAVLFAQPADELFELVAFDDAVVVQVEHPKE